MENLCALQYLEREWVQQSCRNMLIVERNAKDKEHFLFVQGEGRIAHEMVMLQDLTERGRVEVDICNATIP